MPLISGSQGSATIHGSTIGTPSFMSPEQASGLLEQTSTLSDVYSLGATLYVILAGQPPFQGKNAREIVERVKTGDFNPAITKNRNIPKPLNAICQKAMALVPEDRYISTLKLAEDVQRYLADQPVNSYRDSPLAKAIRWVRNYRTAAMALALGLLGVCIASVVAAAMLKVEQNRTEHAMQRETAQKRLAESALESETVARQQTQELLDVVSSNVVPNLFARSTELGDEERILLDQLTQQYEQFASRPKIEPAARANGYLQIGKFQRLLGMRQEASDNIEKAIQELNNAITESPGSTTNVIALKSELANCLTIRAFLKVDDDQHQLALADYREAEQIQVELSDRNPDVADFRVALAGLLVNKGNSLQRLGKETDAMLSYTRATSLFDSIETDSVTDGLLLEKTQLQSNLASVLAVKQETSPLAADVFEKCDQDYSRLLENSSSPELRQLANTI